MTKGSETMVEKHLARFESRFVKTDGCWLWQGQKTGQRGYGYFRLGKITKAHRAAWALYRGEIPPGMCVCHKCDTPACVNPDHLFLGTYKDNNLDRHAKGRTVFKPIPAEVKPRGERHGLAKLTDEAVATIRAGGLSAIELGRRFGVSRRTIYRIWSGETWRHVQ